MLLCETLPCLFLYRVTPISLLPEYASYLPFLKWTATWQNQQNDKSPSEESDKPGHPPSLIRVFAVRLMHGSSLKFSLCEQRRLWSEWADAQADLSLRWAHTHFVGFVMSRLKYVLIVRLIFVIIFDSCRLSRSWLDYKLSRDMTKPTKWLCAQRRLRSALASAQSGQSLRCPHEESLGP